MPTLKHVRSGDPLVIPASTFNTFVDAARDFQQRQRDRSRDAERDFRQSGIVLVRNESGQDRERFDVLAVAGPIVGPNANADEFKRRVAIKGVVPRKRHKGRFAVLLEPVAAGAIGRAVIDGVTCVRVKMVEETDRFADIAKGNPSFLRSALTGAAFLLWVQPRDDRDAPGIAWCIVRIANPTTFEGSSSSSSLSSSSMSSSSGSSVSSSMSESMSSSGSASQSSGSSASGSLSVSSASGSGSVSASGSTSGSASDSDSLPSFSDSDSDSQSSDSDGSDSDSHASDSNSVPSLPSHSGSFPDSSASSGNPGPGPGCFLHGTLVRLADGRQIPIEAVRAGQAIASLDVPGLARDASDRVQYDWLTTRGVRALKPAAAVVGFVRHARHDGFFVINGRIKATFEHPFLVRRGHAVGFCSAELLKVGDALIRHDLNEEAVVSVERVDAPAATVALYVPTTNVYAADGVWVHNDPVPTPSQGSGSEDSEGSDSGGSKGSGSSFGSGSSGSSSGSATFVMEF